LRDQLGDDLAQRLARDLGSPLDLKKVGPEDLD